MFFVVLALCVIDIVTYLLTLTSKNSEWTLPYCKLMMTSTSKAFENDRCSVLNEHESITFSTGKPILYCMYDDVQVATYDIII